MTEDSTLRSKWGRSKLGGTSKALLVGSFVIGILGGAAMGSLAAWAVSGPTPMLRFAVFAICTAPVFTGAGYALLVDRNTIMGAPRNPEASIEASWLERAAARTLGDVLVVFGLTATMFAITGWQANTVLLLGLALGFIMADAGLRYLIIKRRGS